MGEAFQLKRFPPTSQQRSNDLNVHYVKMYNSAWHIWCKINMGLGPITDRYNQKSPLGRNPAKTIGCIPGNWSCITCKRRWKTCNGPLHVQNRGWITKWWRYVHHTAPSSGRIDCPSFAPGNQTSKTSKQFQMIAWNNAMATYRGPR
jgi:hypothetical protein